eukprot:CAMPEP_0197620888 /NCGR_PEP_ID=MMETSP1338-20131121/1598_1 /TAXON_ID=43686 ORGANISM="Pelagodinium beii, Strain RCC1491" /NCGR_SAMPLE_ID=MMETSP1338 /ASSEMBLY_ACC=CAM_ASM_000754 /LENGTH=40 /DNA_ID= /DNA_START= /DNA_END= /DNA_ORIENTATION=
MPWRAEPGLLNDILMRKSAPEVLPLQRQPSPGTQVANQVV